MGTVSLVGDRVSLEDGSYIIPRVVSRGEVYVVWKVGSGVFGGSCFFTRRRFVSRGVGNF